MRELGAEPEDPLVRLMEPFGFLDYNKLQMSSRCALSDSGTISEESSILDFPAVTLRASMERPEALDTGSIVMADVDGAEVIPSIVLALEGRGASVVPADYQVPNASERVARFIQSTAPLHHEWSGLRAR
jgi:UDP-N-acetylglucosamine 2-epimerase (non-hydrolysing)